MKNFLYSSVTNLVALAVIAVVTIGVTTVSLTKKINDDRMRYQTGVIAVVQKNDIPILALSKGVISNLYVQEGKKVKKDDLIAEISNPLLVQQIRTLQQFPDNVSAQTQQSLLKNQLSQNKIYAPADGVVGKMTVTINSPVDEYSKITDIFADSDTRLLTYLTIDQYLVAEKLAEIPAYSPRLDQDFFVSPQELKPDQSLPSSLPSSTLNKVAFYLKLNNQEDSSSLLNGEQLNLKLEEPNTNPNKPIDFFVNFWNSVLK